MVFINIDYAGEKSEHLLKKLFKKFLGRSTNQKFNFACVYSVTKIQLFTKVKDKLKKLSKSNVVFQLSCPSCEQSYIGKTNQTLAYMKKENVTRAYSSITWNFDNCSNVKHLFSNNNFILNDVNTNEFRLNLVLQNTRMIDQSNNWNVLLFKEAYRINEKCPILDNGVKASRKIICFECFNCFLLF